MASPDPARGKRLMLAWVLVLLIVVGGIILLIGLLNGDDTIPDDQQSTVGTPAFRPV